MTIGIPRESPGRPWKRALTTPERARGASASSRRAAALVLCLALVATAAGCDGSRQAEPTAPVLVIGIDGLEWSVLRPLIAAGRCPNLEGLMRRGSFGRLSTMTPTQSPIIWTTIATGRMPREHNILGFVDPKGRPYTSARRGVRALWNIADRHGLTTDVVGWWTTWPAEEIAGVMVSGSSSEALIADNWKPTLLPGVAQQVHPPELEGEVLALADEAGSLPRVEALSAERIFGPGTQARLGPIERKLVQQTLWSIQSDATYTAVAETVLAEHPADLSLVYLGTPDVAGHRFWRHYRPDDFAWPGDPEVDAALACVLDNVYVWTDELVGRLLAATDPGAAVLVVSDHGMTANKFVRAREPDLERGEQYVTGHHHDGEPGVIIAAGPGIAASGDMQAFLRGETPPVLGRVTNVAPTVLALLGIPAAKDMADRAYRPLLTGAALEASALTPVPTHDDGYRAPSVVAMPDEMSRNFAERFGALGYLDLEDAQAGARLVRPGDADPPPDDPGAARDDAGKARPAHGALGWGSCAVGPPRDG